ncbi:MAG TPA: DUF1015 domain-containing protein [Phycisphaerae bacterium]|nr:DUF1015 domain-containing protein [Phycisphaerae bacterium]HPS53274.1 DUF1015 domain-containing protein [Phycisphaerae bacterium]
MKIKAFRGWHYAEKNVSNLIAPPYDILDKSDKDALLAQSPNNIVAVDLPHMPPKELGPQQAYLDSAALLKQWQTAGILVQDAKPAIYAYEQSYNWAGKTYARRAILVGIKASPFGQEIIPHEHTFAGPKADRLRLTECTKAQLSPIFGFYDDSRGATAALWRTASRKPDIQGELNGITEKLWIIDDEAVIKNLAAALDNVPIYIADGHHRCTTAMNYADALKAAGKIGPDDEANYILFALVAKDDPGLLVLPTHRLINGLSREFTVEKLCAELGGAFECQNIGCVCNVNLADADAVLAKSGKHAFGIIFNGEFYVLKFVDPQAMKAAAPAHCQAWRELDVAILQELILDRAMEKFKAADYVVEYTPDGELAKKKVASGQTQVAFCLQGTPLKAVEDVANAGESMPHKSTYFYPKLATGMIIKPLE